MSERLEPSRGHRQHSSYVKNSQLFIWSKNVSVSETIILSILWFRLGRRCRLQCAGRADLEVPASGLGLLTSMQNTWLWGGEVDNTELRQAVDRARWSTTKTSEVAVQVAQAVWIANRPQRKASRSMGLAAQRLRHSQWCRSTGAFGRVRMAFGPFLENHEGRLIMAKAKRQDGFCSIPIFVTTRLPCRSLVSARQLQSPPA